MPRVARDPQPTHCERRDRKLKVRNENNIPERFTVANGAQPLSHAAPLIELISETTVSTPRFGQYVRRPATSIRPTDRSSAK